MEGAKSEPSFPSHCPEIRPLTNTREQAQEQAEEEAERAKVIPTLAGSASGAAGSATLAQFVGSLGRFFQVLRDWSLSQTGHFAINVGGLGVGALIAVVSYGKFYAVDRAVSFSGGRVNTPVEAEKEVDAPGPGPERAAPSEEAESHLMAKLRPVAPASPRQSDVSSSALVPTVVDPAAKSASAAEAAAAKPQEKKAAAGAGPAIAHSASASRAPGGSTASRGASQGSGAPSPFGTGAVGTLGDGGQAAGNSSSPFYALGFNKGADANQPRLDGGAGYTGAFGGEKMDARALQPIPTKTTPDPRALLASARTGAMGRTSAMRGGRDAQALGGRGGKGGGGRAFSAAASAAREQKGAASFMESARTYEGGSTAGGSKGPSQNSEADKSGSGIKALEAEIKANKDVAPPAPASDEGKNVTSWKGDMTDAKTSLNICLRGCLGVAALLLLGGSLTKKGQALQESGTASKDPEVLDRAADAFRQAALVNQVAAGLLGAALVVAVRAAYIGYKIKHNFNQPEAGDPILLGGIIGGLFAAAAMIAAMSSVAKLKIAAEKTAEEATKAKDLRARMADSELANAKLDEAIALQTQNTTAATKAHANVVAAQTELAKRSEILQAAQADLVKRQQEVVSAVEKLKTAQDQADPVLKIAHLDPTHVMDFYAAKVNAAKASAEVTAAQAQLAAAKVQTTVAQVQATVTQSQAAVAHANVLETAAQALAHQAKTTADLANSAFQSARQGVDTAASTLNAASQVAHTSANTVPVLNLFGADIKIGTTLMLISTGAAVVSFSVATLKADKAPTERDCVHNVCHDNR